MIKQVVLLKTQDCSREDKTTDPNASFIPIDLSRFNKPQYITWHLSIYRVSGKFNIKFYFQPIMTGLPKDSCTRVSVHKKTYFIAIITETKRHTHNRICYNVCVPRFLCQATSGSSKHGLKNFAHPSVN